MHVYGVPVVGLLPVCTMCTIIWFDRVRCTTWRQVRCRVMRK